MEPLSVNTFFQLGNFSKKEIFEGCSYGWEVLARLNGYLKAADLGKIEVVIPEGAHLVNPELISIGAGTIVEPGAYIRGPCIIGRECEVCHGAYIRGGVITGDGCVIGHCTEVKSSLLLDEVKAGHFNYVGDSVLGNRVNLGAGAKLANFRFDRSEITILFEGQRLSTGLSKMGAIIGDDGQLGCNTVTSPGTLIGQGVICMPNLNVRGVIPSRATVKSTQKTVVEEYVDTNSQ
ncbi:MAG: Bifunctional protein GlmU [Chlamydiae bacterium]|nr:Bifunctional protein GlmU [Chlamydiota bacterium]